MSRIYCVGGFLSGKEVEFRSTTYIPISAEDHRDYYSLTAKELSAIKKPCDAYYLYTTDRIDFYIWNNKASLKDNVINKYIRHEI